MWQGRMNTAVEIIPKEITVGGARELLKRKRPRRVAETEEEDAARYESGVAERRTGGGG